MKTIVLLALAIALPALAQTESSVVSFPGGRIAYSADGNAHDKDDWAASPVGLLLLDMTGLKDQLVHYEYSNHLGDSKPDYEKEMVLSTVDSAKKIGGFDLSVFYDCQKDLAGAIENLASKINNSTAENPLFIVAAGPMETVWRGINASEIDKRKHVTVISHGIQNPKHSDTPKLKHKLDDIRKLPGGHEVIELQTQNKNLNTRESHWEWLDSHPDSTPVTKYIWSRIQADGKDGDVSDMGMLWYLITGMGDAKGTPAGFKELWLETHKTAPVSADTE